MKSSWYFVRSVSPVNVRVPVIGSVQQTLSTERHVANKAFSLRLPFSRNVCSMSGDTQLQAIWKYLTTNGPSFPVESKNVTFVEGPREFLQELKVFWIRLHMYNILYVGGHISCQKEHCVVIIVFRDRQLCTRLCKFNLYMCITFRLKR